jgi:hypothetical protein
MTRSPSFNAFSPLTKTNAAAPSLPSRTVSFSLETRVHAKVKLTRNLYQLIAFKNIN